MKKKLVVYLAGLLTVLGLGFGQAQFSDVPAGHWAKEAVERIAACGLITGFPDGTFRGNTNLTRYQAALIFQRLLNEIQQGGECVKGQGGGMSEEDMTAIRNAVQELAAELAALGVRVSALEDNAATKDDIARLEAAIEELKSMKAEPAPAGVDEAALADLADRVEAASVAADTALAQAQILAERLDGVEGDVAALKTQVEADADSIRALNELAVLLNQDVLSLQDRVTALEKQLGDIDFDSFANREDVAAIQEFATALRADLVRLSDRVSNLDTRVSGIDSRLAAVEGTRPSLTGSLSARYGYSYTNNPVSGAAVGSNFDVDRLFSGQPWADYQGDTNDNNQQVDEGDFFTGGDTRVRLLTTFGLRRPTVGTGPGFNLSEASVQLRWTQDGAVRLEDAGVSGATGIPQVMNATVTGNLSGMPFSLAYRRFNDFKFTDYFMSNADPEITGGLARGIRVTFNATRAPFSPNITVVAGSEGNSTTLPTGGIDPSGAADYFGIRTVVAAGGINWGLNYAERNVRDQPSGRTGFAVDWNGKLFGLLDLKGEYVASKLVSNPNWDFADSSVVDQAFYVQPGITLGFISVAANYRAIDPQFFSGGARGVTNPNGTVVAASPNANNAGFSIDFNTESSNKRPYDHNTRGFGVTVTLNNLLGLVTVKGEYDAKTNFFGTAGTAENKLAVEATANLFAGFSIRPYYTNITTDAADTVKNDDSRLGVELKHDGKASNALIRGLDLGFEFRQSDQDTNTDFDRTDIIATAVFEANLGFITLKPGVRFNSVSGSAGGSAFKFGIEASTQALDLGFLKPRLSGGFVTVSDNIAVGGPAATSATETFWRVNLGLADFILGGTTFNIGYATLNAANKSSTGVTGNENNAFNYGSNFIYDSSAIGASSYTLSGLYGSWTVGGIGLWFGSFTLDSSDNTRDANGVAFRISYTLSF